MNTTTSTSGTELGKSERDTEDYVKYLLQGTGVDKVDLRALRHELESESIDELPHKFSLEALNSPSPLALKLPQSRPTLLSRHEPTLLREGPTLSKDSTLNRQLDEANLHIAALQQDRQELLAQVSGLTSQVEKLKRIEAKTREDLVILVNQHERDRKRSERVFESVLAKFGLRESSSPAERVLFDVIQSYEDKLAQLTTSQSPQEKHIPISIPDEDKLDSEELVKTRELLVEAQKEIELQRLQLLAVKHIEIPELNTRERIRHDKLAWVQKYSHVDEMDEHYAKDVLKTICSRLSIKDVSKLPNAIEKIEKVVRLVPQMESFIRELDEYVRSVLGMQSSTPQKLTFLLDTIKTWSKDTTDQQVTDFIAELHQVLSVPLRLGSLPLCLKAIQDLLNPTSLHKDVTVEMAQKAIGHFQDLFEVRQVGLVVSRMNELYVFHAEVTSGLERLVRSLNLDGSIQPGRVLLYAAETIEGHHSKCVGEPALESA